MPEARVVGVAAEAASHATVVGPADDPRPSDHRDHERGAHPSERPEPRRRLPAVVEQGGGRTLLFALPALGYHFALRLDEADRIASERIVTANQLLTREYRYP